MQTLFAIALLLVAALPYAESIGSESTRQEEQRQYRICNSRSAPSSIHYRAVTYDGFWGKGSAQYDVTLKQNECSYPQNINQDHLKVWWEAYGSGSYVLPTGNALWLIDERPTYLVMEYNQDPKNVHVRVQFNLLYGNSAPLPRSSYDYDHKVHQGWTTKSSLTSITKASIDASVEAVIEAFTPKVSASISSEVSAATVVTNEASSDIEVKLHFDLSNPVYLYQAQVSVDAPGYGSITGFGGYFTTGVPLPPISRSVQSSQGRPQAAVIV